MTILDVAKKLDANLVNPLCLVVRGGPDKEVCRLVDLTLAECVGRSINIQHMHGQYILDFKCVVLLAPKASDPKAGQLDTRTVFRVVTKPYAGIIDPLLQMIDAIW